MIKTQQKTIYANMEQTGANYSASQSVAPAKQTKHKKSYYSIHTIIHFLKTLGTIMTNKTPAKLKHSSYGP